MLLVPRPVRPVLAVALAAALLAPGRSHAQTYTWSVTTGGSWTSSPNWGSPPNLYPHNLNDTAIFSSTGNSTPKTVTLDAAIGIRAVQFAAGHDLAGRFQALSEPRGATEINRTAKGDREANVPSTAAPSRTVLLKVESLADTSVLIRIPVAKEARNLQPTRPGLKPPAKSDAKKMAVACEPVVSVLTEVAKLLQPGKCVT